MLYGLRLAGLVGLFFLYVPPHLLSKLVLRKSGWPPRFLRHAGLIAGVRPHLEGRPLEAHTLVVANHTSWLDILILGGWAGSAFVSKAELEHTSLLGWIADQNRTLYIDRAARRDSLVQVQRITEALEHQQPLTVFPEGTTGSGRHLLKFRSTLLEAVAPAPEDVKVRPVAIDYGDHADVVGWHSGEPGMVNFKRVLGNRGTMAVTVRLLEPLAPSDDRKYLAKSAQQSIAAALSSLAGRDGL
ncbi:1-acyl-sn-glycerol-3-phosphate acyltransferase [Sphingomonas sp. NSE70-1]|uniref:1-acyl-sn-glycerol-3-phosphate acyltransferase n=1 Tax=Sphingomonas caseinilyticus TaxID=2908205 RepID=A0ABT0RT55_9SPHN|nr:lysophospholipid acyltransferase family protein [Sphingomonas caseinilyticus]MCL6698194.1 1-acyl-sn-glycerol-3-phosphate acyltransferase [Sphingomonas caseinilyticus]